MYQRCILKFDRFKRIAAFLFGENKIKLVVGTNNLL